MLVFNTTFSINTEYLERWEEWMKKTYLPTFKELLPDVVSELYEVMAVVNENSTNYSCQWRCSEPEELEVIHKYSNILLNNLSGEYGENCLHFSTILKQKQL
ncbi:DUF4286 family protein [Marinilabiliaceae bacterium JC017]|nr:DUF4286 family protein [Marinilabiliaceae bacterium JC017]